MVFHVTKDTIEEFRNFLSQLVPFLQGQVKEGAFKWNNNLTDYRSPCKIIIFYNNSGAQAVVFPKFPNQKEDVSILLHEISENLENAISSYQDFIGSDIWDTEVKVHRFNEDPTTYRNVLLHLSEEIIVGTQRLGESKQSLLVKNYQLSSIGTRMNTGGFNIFLQFLPELSINEWKKEILIDDDQIKERKKKQVKTIQKLKSETNNVIKPTKEHFGVFFYPAIWIGEDY